MKFLCSLLLTLSVLSFQAAEYTAPNGKPWNVLFLAIDDLNDWIGSLEGHPQTKTPNLDRLAARSINFRNAHCQAPICNPSRASLMRAS